MFFLVVNTFKEEKWIFRLLAMLFSSGCLCAMIGVAQYLFKLSWIPQVMPPSSTFANRNMAAHYVILTLPLGVGLILNNKHKIWDFIISLMAGLMIAFLVFTRTRAGWLALIVEVLFLIILLVKGWIQGKDARYRVTKKAPVAALAAIMILVMINLGPSGLKQGLREILAHAITRSDTTLANQDWSNYDIRIAIWRNTSAMIKDNFWFGKGLGNHKVFYPLYHQKAVKDTAFSENEQLVNVHNDYLQAFAELGFVGIFLLGWIGFCLIRIILNITSPLSSLETRFWAIGITVAIIGLLVNACLSFPFQRAIPPFIFMTYLGILGSLYIKKNKMAGIIIPGWIMKTIGIVVLVGLMCLIQFHYSNIKFERCLVKVIYQEKLKKWERVIIEGKKGHQYNSYRKKMLLPLMAKAYMRLKKYQKSIKTLKKVIAAYPNYMNVLLNMGVAYDRIDDNKSAMEAFDKVLFIKPDYFKAHNNKAKIYMKEENFQKALEEFKLAAAGLNHGDYRDQIYFDMGIAARIYFDMGIAAMRLKEYKEAAEALNKAIQLNPGWDKAHKILGIIYFQFLNKKKEGVHHLRKALKLNPKIEGGPKIQKMLDRQ